MLIYFIFIYVILQIIFYFCKIEKFNNKKKCTKFNNILNKIFKRINNLKKIIL